MPVIDRADGWRVFFYSNEEGEPSHVHLIKGACKMKVWLHPVSVAKVIDCKAKERKAAEKLVAANRDIYAREWEDYERTKQR